MVSIGYNEYDRLQRTALTSACFVAQLSQLFHLGTVPYSTASSASEGHGWMLDQRTRDSIIER